jgi:PAS domain S-box-containing protein
MDVGDEALRDLRRRVEQHLGNEAASIVGKLSREELERLLHELGSQERSLWMVSEELQKTQAALEEARSRYFELYEAAPVGYVTVDREGGVVEANLTAADILRTPRGRLLQRRLGAVLSNGDGERFAAYCRQIFEGPAGRRSLEVHGVMADGRRIPIQLESVALEEPGRRLARIALIDLTRQRRAEGTLRESEAQLRAVMDAAVDGIITVGLDGTINSFNATAQRIFGYSTEEAGGKRFAQLVRDVGKARPGLRETTGWRKDGSRFPLELGVSEVNLENARRLVYFVRDVTERRQREEELRQAQRLEAVGALASGIAHDFNNLLMGIAGAVQVGLRNLDPQTLAYAQLRRALGATMRGSSLTRQLLRFGDKRRGEASPIELDEVVAGARDLISRLVGEHIQLSFEIAARGIAVRAEPGDIEQILMNLATNARDAMPGGGTLIVRTAPCGQGPSDGPIPGNYVCLVVQDSGIGMDAETKARVFQPFFTTKEVGKGTGLGLSTVFAVARRLGGQVRLESELGEGTTFRIFLPVSEESPALAGGAVERATRGSETVLVVEDDPLVRMAVQGFLEGLGYRPLLAVDPAEGLRIAGQRGPEIDVLLTDVMMPGMLGRRLAEAVREHLPGLPAVFMSAHPSDELLRAGRLEPGGRLLVKPFDAEALGSALRAVLDREGEAAPPPPPAEPAKGLRILLVDDNPDVVESLRDLLAQHDRRVEVAQSGSRALEIAGELGPDIVICDLELGLGMSGYDVARALRHDQRLRGAVLVALTGYDASTCGPQAAEAGFDQVVTKPIDVQRLEDLLVHGRTHAAE